MKFWITKDTITNHIAIYMDETPMRRIHPQAGRVIFSGDGMRMYFPCLENFLIGLVIKPGYCMLVDVMKESWGVAIRILDENVKCSTEIK